MTRTIINIFRILTFRKPLPGLHIATFFLSKIDELERLAIVASMTQNFEQRRFLTTLFKYGLSKLQTIAAHYAPGTLPSIDHLKTILKTPMPDAPGPEQLKFYPVENAKFFIKDIRRVNILH